MNKTLKIDGMKYKVRYVYEREEKAGRYWDPPVSIEAPF